MSSLEIDFILVMYKKYGPIFQAERANYNYPNSKNYTEIIGMVNKVILIHNFLRIVGDIKISQL
jgi:hypothetical protein